MMDNIQPIEDYGIDKKKHLVYSSIIENFNQERKGDR